MFIINKLPNMQGIKCSIHTIKTGTARKDSNYTSGVERRGEQKRELAILLAYQIHKKVLRDEINKKTVKTYADKYL